MYNVVKVVVWNRDCWFENGCMYVFISDDDVDNGNDDDDNEEEEEEEKQDDGDDDDEEQEQEDEDDDYDDKLIYNIIICNEICLEFIQYIFFFLDYSYLL